jgi:hypothetical protein
MIAMSLGKSATSLITSKIFVHGAGLPSGTCPRDHMEKVARLWNLVKAVQVLDLPHDLVQDDERRGSPNTPAVYMKSVVGSRKDKRTL